MLGHRASSAAFRPDAEQFVLDTADEVFAVRRVGPDGDEALVAVNVSGRPAAVSLPAGTWATFGDGVTVGDRLDLPPWSNVWVRLVVG